MISWHDFQGVNAAYILELYERYRRDPQSVDPEARAFFRGWSPPADGEIAAGITLQQAAVTPPIEKIVGVVNLAQAIREFGHLAAHLDPLGSPPPGDPLLNSHNHGLDDADLRQLPADLVGGPGALSADNAEEAIGALLGMYTGTIGFDIEHIRVPEERNWLRDAAETRRYRPPNDPIDPVALLQRLTEVETFEQFLHRSFPGKTRFSIEGLDMMIPMLDELIGASAEAGIYTIQIGMAHRGRLNVLAHVLHKPYAQILAEFKDPVRRMREDDLGWTGDVKYHAGARHAVREGQAIDLVISMPPNPSHLEFVNPVLEGMARAAGTRTDGERGGTPEFNPLLTLPILIHGDAAFPGQGIVAETLNLSRLSGYWTGGTIHIIANNQLGYTTLPADGRSTRYASDIAKGYSIPVLHVNADDPEACIEVARIAFAYRVRFQRDFLINLIGYRRYGHNEGDEPAFTQPRMYEAISRHPTVRAQWAAGLVKSGHVEPGEPDTWIEQHMGKLQGELDSLDAEKALPIESAEPPAPGTARRVKTAVPMKALQDLQRGLLALPEDFNLHPKLQRAVRRRREIIETTDEPTIDWATAEQLAFASILADGIAIRMTGQDVERGTFNQRHAVFHDTGTGDQFTPLAALSQTRAPFEIHDSPLSEAAALGFEYGYNVQEPGRLVIWEAQYGDFINGAQVIIDEFIVSARAKWGQTPSLVLLLPHAWEGAGPDHSSGRLERFLQLAAETNMRIANATTAAQYFHLLRRQALLLRSDPLPLIVMTPKSLLRHPFTASSTRELAQGHWQPIIDDQQTSSRSDMVQRILLCSGKVYVDLVSSEAREQASTVAIVRVEQLYPFPENELGAVLEAYPALQEVVWVQEEPSNMGAWDFMRPRLDSLISGRWSLRYVGRAHNASPAEGSPARHTLNQKKLIAQAFEQADGQIEATSVVVKEKRDVS